MQTNPNINAARVSGHLELNPSVSSSPALIIPPGQSVTITNKQGAIWNDGTNIMMWNNSTLYTIGFSNIPAANIVFSASNTSASLMALTFSNGNGVSFGLSNGVLTASIPAMAGAQTGISGLVANGGTITSGTASFSNINGISFGINGQTITGSHNGITSQSNQNISFFALSNTTHNSSSMINANAISFKAIGSITLGFSNGSIEISAPLALTQQSTQPGIQSIAVSDNTFTTGQVSFSNLNGISFGSNGAGVITASYTVPTQTVQTQSRFNLTLSGNSTSGGAGYQLISSGVLTLAGGNNITISQDGYALTISGANAAGAQTAISGIIASNTTYTSGSVSFRDLNGISWQSTTGQGIQITHALQFTSNTSAITSNALHTSASRVINILAATNNTGGGTASLSSNVSFSNANNFTFYTSAGNAIVGSFSQSVDTNKAGTGFTSGGNIGVSGTLNTNGLSLSITAPTQTVQTLGYYASSQTTGSISSATFDARSVSFIGAGGISVGLHSTSVGGTTNGFIISAAHSSNFRLSNDAVGLNTAKTNVTWTVNSSGISLDAGGYAGTGFTSAGNNIGLSGTHGTNGFSLSATVAAQTVQTVGVYGSSQTTGSISSATYDARSLSFIGAGIISIGNHSTSVGGTTNGIIISAVQTVQTQNMVSINGSTGAISFSNSNNVSFGFNGSTITATATFAQSNQNISFFGLGNTTQNSSTVLNANAVSLNGLGNITVGYSNGSIQISGSQSVQPQSNQNISLFALGNTTQNSSTLLNASNLSLNGLGIITVGYSNGSIQLSATQSVQTQNMVSINGSTGAISFSNSNNVSFGFNGSTVTATATFAQSNQNISFFALGNTTQNSSSVLNANAVSFNGLGDITVGYSNGSIQFSGSQSVDTRKAGTGFTSAGNNIGLSGTLNTNGLSLSATVAAQTNQNISLFALGNTTQNSSTVLNASNLSFNAIGSLTVGYSNGSIQFSAPSALTIQTVQTQSRFNLTVSGNTTSGGAGFNLISSGVLTLAGGNNITLSQDGNAVTISAANAGGAQTAISGVALSNTTYTSGTISFRDLNGISWQSTTGQGLQITHDLQYTSNTSNITSAALHTSASRVINLIAATNNTGGVQFRYQAISHLAMRITSHSTHQLVMRL
jgi:hypothetical protein